MAVPPKNLMNSFTHIELNTHDPTAAKDFYSKVFPDWKFEDMPSPAGPYTMIKPSSGTGGGLFKNPMPEVPSFWLPYIQVEDIKASTTLAAKLGAKIIRENHDVGMGWISILADPTGAAIGLFQSK